MRFNLYANHPLLFKEDQPKNIDTIAFLGFLEATFLLQCPFYEVVRYTKYELFSLH